MSIYSSSSTWGQTCGNPNQSPINLSQATSKPCDLLCELVFDDAYISQANVMVSDEGLVLNSTSGLGTCKFNGEGYTCNTVLITHPSHHTIENIQADGEVIAIFTNPTGKYVCVSSLLRVNPAQTPSSKFLNAFIPYADPTVANTVVKLGDNWGLFMMVPPMGSYFVYDGSFVAPPCMSTTWVVFKSMINIDSNDFALLVKNVVPGSRPIQELGGREVFYNDTEQLVGGPMPRDNKTYMKCRRAGSSGEGNKGLGATKPVTSAPLTATINNNRKSHLTKIHDWASDQIERNGLMEIINVVFMIGAIVIGLRYGWDLSKAGFMLLPMKFGEKIGAFLRWLFLWVYNFVMSFFSSTTTVASTSSTSVGS